MIIYKYAKVGLIIVIWASAFKYCLLKMGIFVASIQWSL